MHKKDSSLYKESTRENGSLVMSETNSASICLLSTFNSFLDDVELFVASLPYVDPSVYTQKMDMLNTIDRLRKVGEEIKRVEFREGEFRRFEVRSGVTTDVDE